MSEPVNVGQKLTLRQLTSSRIFWIAVILVAVLWLITLAFSNARQPDPNGDAVKESAPMPVQILKAQWVTSIESPQEFVGEVRARRSSDLSFERAARITRVLFDEGDEVRTGDVLVELDTDSLEIEKRKTLATKANAEAVLAELNTGARPEVIAAAQAMVNALKAERDLARFIRGQRKKLVGDAISPEEWQQVESKYASTEAQLQSAQSRLDELLSGTRKEKKAAQRALVQQLDEELSRISLQITNSHLKAPYDGIIARRYLDEGVVVTIGQPVLKITEANHLEVVVGIPLSTLPSLSVGQLVDILPPGPTLIHSKRESPDGNRTRLQAIVERIFPEAEPQTRLVPVVFKLPENQFRPGQIVRLAITQKIYQEGVWVPTESLIPAARGMWSVFVVKKVKGVDRAIRHAVSVLFNSGELTLVKGTVKNNDLVIVNANRAEKTTDDQSPDENETLNPGDRIVAEGTHRINQGQKVKVVNSPQ